VSSGDGNGQVARGNRIRLILAQVLAGGGIASSVAVGGVLTEKLSGTMGVAGFAQTASVVGAGVMAIPLARLAARKGRRWSLSLGFGTAAAGAVLILVAVASRQFWLFMVGMLLFGSSTATNPQSRYAAMEYSEASARARSMSFVLWATAFGSVAGPNLSAPGAALGESLGLEPLSGAYLVSCAALLASAAVVSTIRRVPAPAGADAGAADAHHLRPRLGAFAALTRLRGHPRAIFAITAVVTGQMMMTSVMIMTPVSMNNAGMSLTVVGIVISVHIFGMYAASPMFGWLADKVGPARVVWTGVVIFLCSFLLGGWDAAFGNGTMPALVVALCLLGLGWSACLIGGSALLVQSAPVEALVPVQGASDSMMNFGAAALAALARPVLALGGFVAVNAMAFLVLVALVVVGMRAGARPPAGTTARDHDAPAVGQASAPNAQ
jgi:MFS family permease